MRRGRWSPLGLAYLYTDGLRREVPGRFLVVKQDTGEVVAERKNEGGRVLCYDLRAK